MKLAAEHPDTELVCIADVDQESAAALAKEHSCHRCGDYEEMLSKHDVDALFISTPNKFHRATAEAALRSGKHVFCEKPLARTVEEARAIVEAQLRSSASLKVGSNLRFFPNVRKAKELLDQGAIGSPLFLRSWIGHEGWNMANTWFSNPDLSGGGTFLDNGVHVFDLIRWLLGEIHACTGMVNTSLWPIGQVEDNGYGLFETAGGQVAFVHASWTEWAGYMYMEIYGSQGYLHIDCRRNKSVTTIGDRRGSERVFDFSNAPPTSYVAEFSEYVVALKEGRPPAPSGYDGLRAVQMAWGVYEAARSGFKKNLWEETDRAFCTAAASANEAGAMCLGRGASAFS
jgi:predicted dehydrogenase